MQHVVYLAKGAQITDSESVCFVDPPAALYFKGRMPEEIWGIVQATERNLRNVIAKSDRLEVFPYGDPDLLTVRSLMGDHYAWMRFQGFTIRSLESVSIDRDTSSGFPISLKKGEAIKEHDPYFRWYTQTGNRDRPCPIWVANPKMEYLLLEKINDLKIRIFRNPPLDYLLLEKRYFEHQDEALLSFNRRTWSALGFVKEHGGWGSMVQELMWNHRLIGKPRFYYRWDVGEWDKAYGPGLDVEVDRERVHWFSVPLTDDEAEDVRWLRDESGDAYELLPNGEIVVTALSQKSGKYRTSTNNTIGHEFILLHHYVRVCRRLGLVPSDEHARKVMVNYIYSDDMQGATSYPEFVVREELEATYALYGMTVKEFCISEKPEDIHFLGCSNKRWRGSWVPQYNTSRMMFALVFTGGRMSDRERTQRVSGLAHNLAFDDECVDEVVGYAEYLRGLGRWVGAPMITRGDLRGAYLAGSRDTTGPRPNIILQSLHKSTTMNKSSRKLNLDMLIEQKVIERDSKDWLIQMLDPFHDTPITAKGMPDTNLGKSVIQEVQYTQSLKQPASIGNTNNWDTQIVLWPIPRQYTPTVNSLMLTNAPSGALYNGLLKYPGSGINLFPIGGVTAYSVLSGANTYGDSAGTTSPYDVTLGLESSYLNGACRIVGMGIEVDNTTAPLYKQGEVFAYRSPVPPPSDIGGVAMVHAAATFSNEGKKTHNL